MGVSLKHLRTVCEWLLRMEKTHEVRSWFTPLSWSKVVFTKISCTEYEAFSLPPLERGSQIKLFRAHIELRPERFTARRIDIARFCHKHFSRFPPP